MVAEDLRAHLTLDVAHDERLARPRWDAQVVLKHIPGTVLSLNEVLASYVGKDPPGGTISLTCGRYPLEE